jgi:hypothetical protein
MKHSSGRSLAPRAAHSALLLALAAAALTAHEGCSSSSSGSSPDASAPSTDASTTPDTSPADDASTPPSDATAPDTSAPVDDASPTDTSVPDTSSPPFDCTNDDGGGGLQNDLRCTGLYSDWDSKTVSSDVMAYAPGYVLWSDGAGKQRWIYLPPGSKIDNSNLDDWVFPVGTKVWKEFRLGSQRIETRMFTKLAASSWNWTTYVWSSDESSAVKNDTGKQAINGTTYEIPNHGQCQQCHNGSLDNILGFSALGLGSANAQGVTLATLKQNASLQVDMPSTVDIPEDGSGLARAPLGWLHMNCGVACHNRNPSALANGTGLWLRTSAAQLVAEAGTVRTQDLDPYKTAVWVPVGISSLAAQGYYRIKPGDPGHSAIPLLDSTRGDPNIPSMPPLISHQVDTTDVNAVKAWIQSLPLDAGP